MKTIILHSETSKQYALDFIKELPLKTPAGQNYEVLIRLHSKRRSTEQIKRHWARMDWLAENLWVEDKRYSKDAWNEYLKMELLGKIELPGGRMMGVSSPEGAGEYSAFEEAIDRYLSENYGCWIPDENELSAMGE